LNHGQVRADLEGESLNINEKEKKYITFASQIGGMEAAEVVQPHLIELRKILCKYCKGPYSDIIDEFAPIARVDGDISFWDFEGCQKLRINRKERYITIDIGVPKSCWYGIEELEIRKYLIINLKIALKLMVERLEKDKGVVDTDRLFSDILNVEKEFLDKPIGKL